MTDDVRSSSMIDLKRKMADDDQEVNMDGKATKATKHAMSATTLALEDSDPFVQALDEMQQAGERAIALGKERLTAINVKFFAGLQTNQDPRVVQACNRFSITTAELEAVACDIASKVESAPIYKLPEELLEIVFKYLDVASLFSCEDTCQSWRAHLQESAAYMNVWFWARCAVLKGTLAKTDAMWKRIRGKQIFPQVLSLSLWQSPSDKQLSGGALRDRLKQTELIKAFPKWLLEFRFVGDLRNHETKFWDFITDCSYLKVLHWDSQGCPDWGSTEIRYDVGDATLKLEEFKFSSAMRIQIDGAFVRLLNQVKRLYLVDGMGNRHVLAILSAAEDYLEEVSIAGVNRLNSWLGYEPNNIKASFAMNKLQRFSLISEGMDDMCISAPNTTSVLFGNGNLIDWTLLDSCRSGLKSLHIALGGIKTEGRFGHELFDMPQLESLHLDYRREKEPSYGDKEKESIVVSYRDFSAAAFWNAVLDSCDKTKKSSILPRLQYLKIIHDPMLDESAILKYLEMRSLLGQPALKEIKVFLANHCSDSTSALDAYRTTNPGLEHRRFEDWKDENTREWSLLKELKYYSVKWDEVDACRKILKKLRIQPSYCGDERLHQELFNMPLLEELKISFREWRGKAKEQRSTIALWTSYLSGTTGKDDVVMQDILPKLQKLEVINDSLVKEEVIVAMVEVRERLGFAPIDSMIFQLAGKCSDSFEKLEALKGTMPRLTYKRFGEWGPQAEVAPDSEDEEEEVIEEVEEVAEQKSEDEVDVGHLKSNDDGSDYGDNDSEEDDAASESDLREATHSFFCFLDSRYR